MRFSELDGARVGIWGAGRETRSFAARLRDSLPSARIAVVAYDEEIPASARGELDPFEPDYVAADGAFSALSDCDAVVRSPGVSMYRPELTALRETGIPVTTATSLWLAEHGATNVIGVTGTKGKSTTAALAAHLARAAGGAARVAGNIGAPALDLLDVPADELVVVELSSYQIADLANGPEIAVVTNVYPEHVHWHETHDAYYADKLRLLRLPGVRATVLNARDARTATADAVEPHPYGTPDGWDATPEGVAKAGRTVVATDDLPLRGEHNALNLCAVLTALELLGVEPPLPAALDGFAGLPHRLDVVHDDGVLWIDDSISTTPESTLAALESFPGREIVLLAGGQDRGQAHTELARALAERDVALIGLPDTGSPLVAAAREAGVTETRDASDMRSAVALARQLAEPGAVVLLSPAAPSYNAYRSFEERGAHFAALARDGAG
jgi:UDP-N-acetylmuramoyl-L-alanine---L-glutamate ligase